MRAIYVLTTIFLCLLSLFPNTMFGQQQCFFLREKIGTPVKEWELTAYLASQCDTSIEHLRLEILDSIAEYSSINRIRIEVRSGAENPIDYYSNWITSGCDTTGNPAYQAWLANRYTVVNDNDNSTINLNGFHFSELDYTIQSIVIPLQERYKKNGRILKTVFSYIASEDRESKYPYTHSVPEDYAEFVLATYQHLFRQYNIIPDYWEVLHFSDYHRHDWIPSEMGPAILTSAEVLQDHGYVPNFIAPTASDSYQSYLWSKELFKDTSIRRYVSQVSYCQEINYYELNNYLSSIANSFNIPIYVGAPIKNIDSITTVSTSETMHEIANCTPFSFNVGTIKSRFYNAATKSLSKQRNLNIFFNDIIAELSISNPSLRKVRFGCDQPAICFEDKTGLLTFITTGTVIQSTRMIDFPKTKYERVLIDTALHYSIDTIDVDSNYYSLFPTPPIGSEMLILRQLPKELSVEQATENQTSDFFVYRNSENTSFLRFRNNFSGYGTVHLVSLLGNKKNIYTGTLNSSSVIEITADQYTLPAFVCVESNLQTTILPLW